MIQADVTLASAADDHGMMMPCTSHCLQLPPPAEASGETAPDQPNRLIFFRL